MIRRIRGVIGNAAENHLCPAFEIDFCIAFEESDFDQTKWKLHDRIQRQIEAYRGWGSDCPYRLLLDCPRSIFRQDKCIAAIFVGILHMAFVPNIGFWMMRMLYMLCLPVGEDLDQGTGECAHAASGRLFAYYVRR